MTNPNYTIFDMSDPENADYCRGYWWSPDRSDPPAVFNNHGNGSEPVGGGYFGPFATYEEAVADADADLPGGGS